MDPILMIVKALAAGTARGLKDTGTSALNDAYADLRELVRRRFAAVPAAEAALAEHEKAPEVWQAPLAAALETTGAGVDERIIEAAWRVLELVEASSTPLAGYMVTPLNTQDSQIGKSNKQSNIVRASRRYRRKGKSTRMPKRGQSTQTARVKLPASVDLMWNSLKSCPRLFISQWAKRVPCNRSEPLCKVLRNKQDSI